MRRSLQSGWVLGIGHSTDESFVIGRNHQVEREIKVANAAASKVLDQGKGGGINHGKGRWAARDDADDSEGVKRPCRIVGCSNDTDASIRTANFSTRCSGC